MKKKHLAFGTAAAPECEPTTVKDADIVKIALFKIPKTLARRQTERTRARTHKPRPPIGYSRRALPGVTKKPPKS